MGKTQSMNALCRFLNLSPRSPHGAQTCLRFPLLMLCLATLGCEGRDPVINTGGESTNVDSGSEPIIQPGEDAGGILVMDAGEVQDSGQVADAGLGPQSDAGLAMGDAGSSSADAGLTQDAGFIEYMINDFALPDVNPTSGSFNLLVSPGQFSGQVSAWYFGHAT